MLQTCQEKLKTMFMHFFKGKRGGWGVGNKVHYVKCAHGEYARTLPAAFKHPSTPAIPKCPSLHLQKTTSIETL